MKTDFNFIKSLSSFNYNTGVLCIILAIILGIIGLLAILPGSYIITGVLFSSALFLLILGISACTFAELLMLLVAIEHNTRKK